MNEAEFIYNGNTTIIQCGLEDKLKDICNKFTTKTQLNINNLYFLCNGNTINLESKFNQINQGKNKIKILVNNINETQNLFLEFKINNYNVIINFTKSFDIKVEYGESLNKKIYNGSFTLEELKNKSKFFKMFDSVQETYNDIKLLLDQNSFYIQTYEKSITLCIKKQLGIQYDIVFPLKEGSVDIKEIVAELCEKNIVLERKIDILTEKNLNLEKQINEINIKYEKKIDDLEKQIKNILNEKNEILEINENICNQNDGLTNDEREKINKLFDEKIPKKFNLLYNGLDREEFFEKCNGKDNLLFLINGERGMKYGGYMSSKLIKNKKGKSINIRDEKSFIFNLDTLKKFKVIKPEQAIEIRDGYLICFGGNASGNDFYIYDNKTFISRGTAGMNSTDSYGDKNYEITIGKGCYKVNDIKIYQLFF